MDSLQEETAERAAHQGYDVAIELMRALEQTQTAADADRIWRITMQLSVCFDRLADVMGRVVTQRQIAATSEGMSWRS